MNVAEILKKCPRGTKLYSSLWGEVELVEVIDDPKYPIRVSCPEYRDYIMRFDKEGKNYVIHKEPTLFPSKDQRDWSKFGLSGKKNRHQFKPFDRVLARDSDDEFWSIEHFGHIESDGSFICGGKKYSQCIPYEGNDHLSRTKNKP